MIDFNNEDDEEKKKRSISERTKSIMAMSGMKPIEHNTTNFDIEDNSINISERTKNIMAMSGMKPIEEYILQDTKDFNDLINPNDNNQEYNISRKENDVSDDESIQDYYNTNENLGEFDTVNEANENTELLHNQQEEELFNDTQINEEIEKPKEDNIFINGLKWIKDFIVSIPAKLISTGYSITRVAQEGNAERQEMLDNMTDEEINSLDNKNKTLQNFVMGNSLSKTFDQTTSVGQMKDTRTKLYIKDTIQDTARDFGNGIISIANNILNFFSFGNLGKNTIPEIKDFSVLQNSEQYGNYKSKEELTKAIQEDVNNAYKQIGIYNPSANKWGGVTADIIATIALGNAGMSNTASIVSVSGVSSLGETGSVEESTKSVVTSYLFSKIVDSKTLNKIVKEPTSKATQNVIKKVVAKNPEIINTDLKKAIVETLPQITATFTNTASSRLIANELNSMASNGIDTFNGEVQKNILADSILWASLSAANEGYKGVNFKLKFKNLNEIDTKKQLNEWYKTLGLDAEKQYSAEDIKKQYRTLAKKYHSDITSGSDEQMININLAYEGINKYLKNGTIFETTIESEPTNEAPIKTNVQSQTNNEYGIIKTDKGFYMDNNSVLSSVATNIANTQTIEAITSIKNNNGDILGFEKVKAIPFEVKDSQIENIQPALTKTEDGLINVIDINSGTILLSNASNYSSAINKVTEALQSKDATKQKYIIEEINKNRYSNSQAIDTIISNVKNQVINKENSILKNEKQFNDIKKLNEQISDKSIYNNTAAVNVFKTVSNNIKNIDVIEQDGMSFVNSLDKNGNVVYQQKINSLIYNGAKIKSIINNAINNADLSDIYLSDNQNTNMPQNSSEQNTDNLNTKTTNYTPEKVKSIVEPFSKQQEYTIKEMANIWNNEINAKNLDTIYDNKGNIQSYIAIEQDGDNLVVNRYDKNDNNIASEIIPIKNGKYANTEIIDTINKILEINQNNNMSKDIKSFSKQKGGKNNGRKEQSTYNGQETYRMQKGEDTSRKSQNAGSNGMVQNTQSKGLSNYQKQQQEKLGKDFKATNVETARQSKNELIVSHGFKGATGINMGVFETNKSTTESAFYSDNNIYVKHNSMASKKSTNFKPYHEFGHWLKDNKNSQWKKLYDIVDNSITKKQMEDYKNVLNDKSIFDNMTEEQQKDYIINEIISDYVGNWANDIINWKDYLSVISEEYQQFISDIALENEFVGYNVFGTLEQQEQIFDEISNIMNDIIGKDNTTVKSNKQEVTFSSRYDLKNESQISKNLSKDIDDLLKLQYNTRNEVLLRYKTPQILVKNGFKDLPMYTTPSHLLSNIISATKARKLGIYDKDTHYHNLGKETYIKVIEAIDNPIAILKSISKTGSKNSIVIITDIVNKKGEHIIVPVYIDGKATYNDIRIDTNKIKTVYGKSDIKNFVDRIVKQDYKNLIYLTKDKNKRQFINGPGLQLSNSINFASNSSISQNNQNVKNTAITNSMQKNQNNTNQAQNSDRNDMDNNSNQNYTPEQQEQNRKVQEQRRQVAKMIKERSFFKTAYNSNTSKEFKAEMIKNRSNYQYEPISNERTMQKVRKKFEATDIQYLENEFLNMNDLKTAEDTALGELLIHKAIERGDYKQAQFISANLADKLTTAGQTIQAAAMMKRMTPDGMLLFAQRKINQINDELNQKFKLNEIVLGKTPPQLQLTEEQINFITDLMNQMQDLENKKTSITDGASMEIIEREQDIIIGKVMAKIGENIPTTFLDKLTTWRNISLLLNSKTITRNLISNGLFSSIENVVDAIGVPIDKAISLITGQRSLLLPNIKTQKKGFKKGLDYAIYDTKEGISTSLGGNKYDLKPTKTFKNKLLQKLETATYFGVEGLDRPFMQAKYDSALEMIMKLEGLSYGKDIPTNEMKQEALEIAKYTTFKDKNAISDFLSKTKNTLNLGKSIGAADVIGLTYTNIPGNLTKKAIDYSPVGLYNIFKAYKKFKTQQLNNESTRQAQRELIQSTSRVLIGTGIMAISVNAFLAGILTASGDDEDDKVKSLTNQENYAINVSGFLRWITGGNPAKKNGDLYVTYSNYEPLSSIIAASAEMTGAAKKGDNSGTIFYKGLTTWINTIAELSTLNNFSSLFEYGDLGGTLTRSISQFPSSFIPTTSKQIAQLFETHSKSSYSDNFFIKNFWNPIVQRIPGLSSTLESNYDTMGNEEKSFNESEGIGRIFNVFLNTSFTSTVDMNDIEQELYDLYLSTGSTDHLPLEVKNYFTYKSQKITLTAKEKAQYQETLGKRTAEAFKKEMATDNYRTMTDEDKVNTLKNIISDLNTEVRGEVVLEKRGLAFDTSFTPAGSSLSKNGYRLNLNNNMLKEYEQIASEYYNKYAKQGIYSEEKLEDIKSKAKDYAKNQLFQKYKNNLVKTKK